MFVKSLAVFGVSLILGSSAWAKEMIIVPPNTGMVVNAADRDESIYREDLSENQIRDLRAHGYLVEAPIKYSVAGWVDSNPRADANWAASAMSVPEAHQLSSSKGAGVKVCIADTGIDANHSLLKGKVVDSASMFPDESVDDGHGHGTHVASLVAGSTDLGASGTAAQIIAVKVLKNTGNGSQDSIAKGIDYCVRKGAKIINLSLSSPLPSSILQSSIEKAVRKGVVIVAAAGNTSDDIRYPAAYSGVVSVGATTSAGRIAPFSCRGNGLDFVAPGAGILGARAGGGLITMSGTSMASPFVAGMYALKISRKAKGLKTKSLGYSSNLQGKGLVNAYLTATN